MVQGIISGGSGSQATVRYTQFLPDFTIAQRDHVAHPLRMGDSRVTNSGGHQDDGNVIRVLTGTTANSEAVRATQDEIWGFGSDASTAPPGVIDFDRLIIVSFALFLSDSSTNSICRLKVGEAENEPVRDMVSKGFQLSIKDADVFLGVHNGTDFSETQSDITLNNSLGVRFCRLMSLAGTVTLEMRGMTTLTRTDGPTGEGDASKSVIQLEAENNADEVDTQVFLMHTWLTHER